jgi:hypothetical protein
MRLALHDDSSTTAGANRAHAGDNAEALEDLP